MLLNSLTSRNRILADDNRVLDFFPSCFDLVLRFNKIACFNTDMVSSIYADY